MILRLVIFVLCVIRIIGQEDFSDTNNISTPSINNESTVNEDPNVLEIILNYNLREKVSFFLYKRNHRNKGELLIIPKQTPRSDKFLKEIYFADFNPRLQTKLLVHGWRSNEESDTVQNIKNNYLSRKNLNIISVDYRDIAANNFYFTPVFQIREVGKYIAELIDYLVTVKKARTEDFHLIGHSLGSHLAGYAAAFVKTGKVGRVTGLDPAILGFEWSSPEWRLDSSDATFVDVIHTAAGSCGFRDPIGHVDFYPNGGIIQPGCGDNIFEQMACSHGRAHHLFAESILNTNFFSYPSSSWSNYVKGDYNLTDMIRMGDAAPHEARGLYFLRTNPKPPFAVGSFAGAFGFFWDTFNLLNG